MFDFIRLNFQLGLDVIEVNILGKVYEDLIKSAVSVTHKIRILTTGDGHK